MKIITRAEAIKQNLPRYYTGRLCKNGHLAERRVGGHGCVSCISSRTKLATESGYFKEYYQENRENHLARSKVNARNNPESVLKASKAWNARNKDQQAAYRAEFYKDPEKKQAFLDKCKEYRTANKAKYQAHTRKRQAAKLQRTPSWLTEDDFRRIEDFYIQAVILTEATGVSYEVDHIIPLQGKIVSGLHIPDNLQVITQKENNTKSNKFDQDIYIL